MTRAVVFAVIAALGSVSASPPPTMAPEAVQELSAAIDILKTRHMNRDRLDWAKVETAAFETAKTAKTAADTYPAIRAVIAQLGEKHTALMPAENVKARQSGTKIGNAEPPPFNAPEAWDLQGGVALLRLPGFMGREADDRVYVATVRTALQRSKAHHICRFVVDLRGNWGGNMYPMLSALKPLLGSAPYGYWTTGAGDKNAWAIPDHPIENGLAPDYDVAVPELKAHVAVLIDASTASSGEFTAMAFQSLPNVKTFGAPSAGYLTANQPATLPDGAEIYVSTSWATDRLGTSYRDRIEPDVKAGGGQPTVDAALTWLKGQSCR